MALKEIVLFMFMKKKSFIWQHKKVILNFMRKKNGSCALLITSAQRQQDRLIVTLGVVLKKDRAHDLSLGYKLDVTSNVNY